MNRRESHWGLDWLREELWEQVIGCMVIQHLLLVWWTWNTWDGEGKLG